MTTAEPTVVRLSGNEGILSAIPATLGFHPADSIVVVTLIPSAGSSMRIGPIARVNIADYVDREAAASVRITRGLAGSRATSAFLVSYGEAVDVSALAAALGAAGIQVTRVLHVGNEAQPIDPRLHAEVVGAGGVVEADRAAVVARVEYDPHAVFDPVHRTFLNMLREPATRDEVLAAGLRRHETALADILAVCREIPDDGGEFGPVVAANLAAVAGILAHRGGNGALAYAAFERALRIDPDHRLARVAECALSIGMPPKELDSIIGAVDHE